MSCENELLTVEEMASADRAAIESGISALELMERAGRAVAEAAARIARERPILVLCGPGNNGGDGYVAARYLRSRGHNVRVSALGDPTMLSGDAAANFKRWQGKTESLSADHLAEDTVIVDALFGAGLARPIEGVAAEVLERAMTMNVTSIAVDLPSGINGNTGEEMGPVVPAHETVTFFRKKPGHLLYPGRGLSGIVTVVDIGIPTGVLDAVSPETSENSPSDWRVCLSPLSASASHKFSRGHLVIAGGERMTGAARIAARSARRTGAGLVTLAIPERAFDIYASDDPGNLIEDRNDFAECLSDPRKNAVLLGPGLGFGAETRELVHAALNAPDKSVVLDADALTSFADDPASLFDAISGPVVMTPHAGEFARLFGTASADKLTCARRAAQASGAVIVLKGADTVIASPDGGARINANAPPWLATAGSGDALSGMIGALLALGAGAFDSASAGVWLHGAAGQLFGPGLVAEDIPEQLPAVLSHLLRH